jgi:hypothetical protein
LFPPVSAYVERFWPWLDRRRCEHDVVMEAFMNDQWAEPTAKSEPLLGGWLTRAQVASEIGVSVDTLARWESQGIGPPCVRIGRKVL